MSIIPPMINDEMFCRFMMAIIIGTSLVICGLVIYFTYGLIGLLITTLGLSALTFGLGITNTMVRVEDYFNGNLKRVEEN